MMTTTTKTGSKWSFGIDYSMTCPAVCAYTPSDVRFWYCHATKYTKDDSPFGNLTGDILPEYQSVTQRARYLAKKSTEWILQVDSECQRVAIEDYAFNATGRVFHIGENAGILKYVLDELFIEYEPIPPTVIKKFATGKGNADKNKMTLAFCEAYAEARAWIPKMFPRTQDDEIPAKSPLADLADAYWIARHIYERG